MLSHGRKMREEKHIAENQETEMKILIPLLTVAPAWLFSVAGDLICRGCRRSNGILRAVLLSVYILSLTALWCTKKIAGSTFSTQNKILTVT